MLRIGPLLVLVIDILAILDVIKSNKEVEKKVLWIAIIILLPLFGAIAWYLVSRKIIDL